MSQPTTARPRTKSIGHYILGKTIGEGTFGKVKLGTHILTGERVAVKILEKERIVEVADVERVAREVHILKLVRHPHVVQLYEIIETRRQLYLIMEYAGNGELFDFIVAHGRVQEKEACRFFHQIIAGVERIHSMNIVHRDLKPENLLLDDRQCIKIVDFGLSNVYREGQLLKTACGSPCYAAPEMIAGRNYVPSLCDLWSCGVILFALVCGYLPFEDQNTAALYRKILAADYKPPHFISENARSLIAGLLTVDPNRRLTVVGVRQHNWYRQIQEASLPGPEIRQGVEAPFQVDEEVLRELDAFGFPRDYAVRCLEVNKHNHVTTTYHLLSEKRRRMLERLDQLGQMDPRSQMGGFASFLGRPSMREGSPCNPHELRVEDLGGERLFETHTPQAVSTPRSHAGDVSRPGTAAQAGVRDMSPAPQISRPGSADRYHGSGSQTPHAQDIATVSGVSAQRPRYAAPPLAVPWAPPQEHRGRSPGGGEPSRASAVASSHSHSHSQPASPSPVQGAGVVSDTPRRRASPTVGPYPTAPRGHHAGPTSSTVERLVSARSETMAPKVPPVPPVNLSHTRPAAGPSVAVAPRVVGKESSAGAPPPKRTTASVGMGPLSARATYSTRPPVTPRDAKPADAVRKPAPTSASAGAGGAAGMPQSARARIGGRPPVPSHAGITPRTHTGPHQPALSARGDRPGRAPSAPLAAPQTSRDAGRHSANASPVPLVGWAVSGPAHRRSVGMVSR